MMVSLLNMVGAWKIRDIQRKTVEGQQGGVILRKSLHDVQMKLNEGSLSLTHYQILGEKKDFDKAMVSLKELAELVDRVPEKINEAKVKELKRGLLRHQKEILSLVEEVGNRYRRSKQSKLTTNSQSEVLIISLGALMAVSGAKAISYSEINR